MDRRRDGQMEKQTTIPTNTQKWTDGWADGQTDGQTDRQMDRRTDRQTYFDFLCHGNLIITRKNVSLSKMEFFKSPNFCPCYKLNIQVGDVGITKLAYNDT